MKKLITVTLISTFAVTAPALAMGFGALALAADSSGETDQQDTYSDRAAKPYFPAVQQAGDITYITGGIGDEERNALEAVQQDYNLHVLSASVDGAYTGTIHITISDSHQQELLSTDTGPLFYAQLPAGHYVVEEERRGQSKKQSIVIGSNKPASIIFRWK